MAHQRVSGVVVIVSVLVVLGSAGLVQAAVTGDFSTTYDADQSTDVSGREVQVDGTLEFTGSNAVNPQIVIRGGPQTVLDTTSVEVFVEGGQAVNFETVYREGAVVLQTDEIPAGTEVRVQFTVYPVGTNQTNATAARVTTNFETPEGEAQSREFTPMVSLENSPPQQVMSLQEENQRLENRVSELEGQVGSSPDWRTRFWALLGIVGIAVLIGGVIGIIRIRAGGPNGIEEPPEEPP